MACTLYLLNTYESFRCAKRVVLPCFNAVRRVVSPIFNYLRDVCHSVYNYLFNVHEAVIVPNINAVSIEERLDAVFNPFLGKTLFNICLMLGRQAVNGFTMMRGQLEGITFQQAIEYLSAEERALLRELMHSVVNNSWFPDIALNMAFESWKASDMFEQDLGFLESRFTLQQQVLRPLLEPPSLLEQPRYDLAFNLIFQYLALEV